MTDTLGADSATREVPGVGRLTVPDDHPVLVELLYRAVQDAGIIGILSDWLRDRDDDRADLVADLAARGVIPEFTPARDEVVPLVAGGGWGAVRRPNGVRGLVYPGTHLAAAIRAAAGEEGAGGWDRSPFRFEHRIPPRGLTRERIRSALDCCRGRFLFAAFGTRRPGVIALRTLFRGGGVKRVPYLLSVVAPAVGARWLNANDQRRPNSQPA
jgi:hypothetical protein